MTLNLAHTANQLLTNPQLANHPTWQARAEAAIELAAILLDDLLGPTAATAAWEAFWQPVPDAWLDAHTWRALAARYAAVRAHLAALSADPAALPGDLVARLHAAFFAAAPDPAPHLRPTEEAA